MSETAAETASKVSKARTRVFAGYTVTFRRPSEMAAIDCASRFPLAVSPGLSSVQSVTSLNSFMPCAIAGIGKPAMAPAPSSIARRRVFIVGSRTKCTTSCAPPDFQPLSPRQRGGRPSSQEDYRSAISRTRVSGVGSRLLIVIFGIGAVAALVAGAAIYAFVDGGRSLVLIDRRVDPILASVEVSRSVERIVTAASALSAATTEERREHLFARLSRQSAKLQSLLAELHDGGINAQRM